MIFESIRVGCMRDGWRRGASDYVEDIGGGSWLVE
jgi:hypothetical protein